MEPFVREVTGRLVVDYSIRNWCLYPYYGHPKGCPNWNKSEKCPPKVDYIDKIFDLEKRHWFVFVPFNIRDHSDIMKAKHPAWSEKQCRCVLYWQNSVRKKLREFTEEFIAGNKSLDYTMIPEASGVNVFRTCHRIGVMIRKNPKKVLYKISMIGHLIT